MAYDKHVWQCGEAITTEKLNHMEDGIASGGGGTGYTCEASYETLTEETVTTVAEGGIYQGALSYDEKINSDIIIVTFDGVEYECPRISVGVGSVYGGFVNDAPDFSEYPFVLASIPNQDNALATQTAGTYSIKIEALEHTVTQIDPCFKAAVQSGGSVSVSVEGAVQAYTVYVRNTSGVTIEAGQWADINLEPLTGGRRLSSFAAWGDINPPSGIVAVPGRIQNDYVSVAVYNKENSAVYIPTGEINAKIICFGSVPSACVLLGSGCSGK